MNKIIDSIHELPEVIKYKKLEKMVDDNIEYKNKLKKMFEYQKQMINSKHYNLENNYYLYLEKYNEIKKELEEDVIVSMYLDSLEEVNELLQITTSIIENKINDELKKEF